MQGNDGEGKGRGALHNLPPAIGAFPRRSTRTAGGERQNEKHQKFSEVHSECCVNGLQGVLGDAMKIHTKQQSAIQSLPRLQKVKNSWG